MSGCNMYLLLERRPKECSLIVLTLAGLACKTQLLVGPPQMSHRSRM